MFAFFGRRFVGVAPVLALLLAGFVAPSCGTPLICDPDQRTELLTVQLGGLQPSQAFTLKTGYTGWIQVTRLPVSAEGPLGTIGPVAGGALGAQRGRAKGDHGP